MSDSQLLLPSDSKHQSSRAFILHRSPLYSLSANFIKKTFNRPLRPGLLSNPTPQINQSLHIMSKTSASRLNSRYLARLPNA